jgi:hypothetical protein
MYCSFMQFDAAECESIRPLLSVSADDSDGGLKAGPAFHGLIDVRRDVKAEVASSSLPLEDVLRGMPGVVLGYDKRPQVVTESRRRGCCVGCS